MKKSLINMTGIALFGIGYFFAATAQTALPRTTTVDLEYHITGGTKAITMRCTNDVNITASPSGNGIQEVCNHPNQSCGFGACTLITSDNELLARVNLQYTPKPQSAPEGMYVMDITSHDPKVAIKLGASAACFSYFADPVSPWSAFTLTLVSSDQQAWACQGDRTWILNK